jgi:hypothetical protein
MGLGDGSGAVSIALFDRSDHRGVFGQHGLPAAVVRCAKLNPRDDACTVTPVLQPTQPSKEIPHVNTCIWR